MKKVKKSKTVKKTPKKKVKVKRKKLNITSLSYVDFTFKKHMEKMRLV